MDKDIKQYIRAGKKNLIGLYILSLCGVTAPLLVITGLLPLIASIFAFVNRNVADRYLATHYTFLLRTFFIGLFGGVILGILYTAFLMITLSFPSLIAVNVSEETMYGLLSMFITLQIITYLSPFIWLLLRIIYGLRYLLNDTAHPNYKTFWVK